MIAVGVDGSAGGRRAIRFGVAEAERRHCPLLAIRVVPVDADDKGLTAEVRAEVETASGMLLPDLEVEIGRGSPVDALVAVSERAELLVVGSSTLGNVSTACAQLARCPVVVVPPGAEH